jgi:hypothetical protein
MKTSASAEQCISTAICEHKATGRNIDWIIVNPDKISCFCLVLTSE